jgi:hypothetical protein
MLNFDVYQPNGYVDMKAIIQSEYTFIWIYGGRGTGKTFNALTAFMDLGWKYIFSRRTPAILNTILAGEDLNPFNKINQMRGTHYQSFKIPKTDLYSVYDTEIPDGMGKPIKTGEQQAICAPLSTFSKIRGVDLPEYKAILLDEFVPELHERRFRAPGTALKNMYETVNRNRELEGHPPVKLICLTNSNQLGSDIVLEWNLARPVYEMVKNGHWYRENPLPRTLIIMLKDSPISEAKKHTALYEVSQGTDFYEMSIENEFAYDEPSEIRSIPLNQLKPIVNVGEITIYLIKTQRKYYVSSHYSGAVPRYAPSDTSLERFCRKYFLIWEAYLDNRVVFEDYISEILFRKYFD